MHKHTKKIRAIASDLLKEKKVEGVIGFRQGTMPMINQPYWASTPEEAEKLIWDSHCFLNLSSYLINRKDTVGIIAKGCDSRNIVNQLIENKIQRDSVVIIGVPCSGMIDRLKVTAEYPGKIDSLEDEEETVSINGSNGSKSFSRQALLQENCIRCNHRNPVIYDVLVSDQIEESNTEDDYEDVQRVESMSVTEKRSYFEEAFSSCIRCYACRNACPLCYCPTCFVDESQPQWIGKSNDQTDTLTFHLIRALHCAGRCTDCGTCEQVCPQNINMRILTRKMSKDCSQLYGWKSGLDPEQRPPLETFKINDPNDLFK